MNTATPTPATAPAAAPAVADQNASPDFANMPVVIETSAYDPPAPEKIAADLRAADANFQSEVPTSAAHYFDPPGFEVIPPAERLGYKQIAFGERWAPSQFNNIWESVRTAKQEERRGYTGDAAYQANALEQFRRAFGDDDAADKHFDYAEAYAKHLFETYPKARELFTPIVRSNVYVMLQLGMLGALRANRK